MIAQVECLYKRIIRKATETERQLNCPDTRDDNQRLPPISKTLLVDYNNQLKSRSEQCNETNQVLDQTRFPSVVIIYVIPPVNAKGRA